MYMYIRNDNHVLYMYVHLYALFRCGRGPLGAELLLRRQSADGAVHPPGHGNPRQTHSRILRGRHGALVRSLHMQLCISFVLYNCTYIHTYVLLNPYMHSYIQTYIHTYMHTYIHTHQGRRPVQERPAQDNAPGERAAQSQHP